MQIDSLEQQVGEYLVIANDLKKVPDAALMFCRKANECILHHIYNNEHKQFPTADKTGKYPTINNLLNDINDIRRQTKETIYSINAQTRAAVHYNHENIGEYGSKSYDIDPVISQIKAVFQDITKGDVLDLDKFEKISTEKKKDTIKKTISEDLNKKEITKTNSNFLTNEEKQEVKQIMATASARNYWIDFDAEELYELGCANVMNANFELALEYLEKSIKICKESEDGGIIHNLIQIGYIKGNKGEVRVALKNYKHY